MPCRGHDLGLGGPFEQRPVVLRGDEGGGPEFPGQAGGLGDLPAGKVGMPDIANLPLGDELAEGGQGLPDRSRRIGRVDLVEVEVVGTKAAQRVLDRAPDVAPAALGARGRPVAHVGALVPELRCQDHLVTPAGQYLAEDFLRSPAPVHVRRVEQGNARLDGRIDDRAGRVGVQPAAEVVAAEPRYGYE